MTRTRTLAEYRAAEADSFYTPSDACEICERPTPANGRHPCRFERACACWYGVACHPAGASLPTTAQTLAVRAMTTDEIAVSLP